MTHADRVEKVREIRETTDPDVLASVNELAGDRIGERPGAAAKP